MGAFGGFSSLMVKSLTLVGCIVGSLSLSAAEPSPSQTQFFEAKIRPILANKCYDCHSAASGKSKGGLFLDTAEATLKGGNTGPAIVPGNPDKSLLIQAVRYTDPDMQMPPKNKKLSNAEIADLTTWVKMGAPDPRKTATVVSSSSTPRKIEKSDHWAFQPVVRPAIPEVTAKDAVFNPIDAFVVAQQEKKGIQPAPVADKRLLIRRATFDLVGLPPTPEEVEDFLKDTSPKAFEKVINRLLDSPQYGERWGRFWLDSARYSDTKGDVKKKKDTPDYPFAWTYRDYVIRAFNQDKPYNQFIMEQIAADRLVKGKDNSNLAALGFLTIGQRFMNNKNDIIDDRIDAVSKSFLGLTVACARCHDHKFDPIPTADYYSLYGIFASSMEPDTLPAIGTQGTPEQYQDYVKQWTPIQRELQSLQQFTDKDKRKGAKNLPKPQMTKKEMAEKEVRLKRELNELDETHPAAPVRAMALVDSPKAADAPILIRGEAQSPGQIVPRRFLEVLSGPERPVFQNGSGRLELAMAIASPKNPLTPRVMVNRIWQHHFGEGLVSTPDDFGNQSTPPTHPELLDYLASEFMKQGWSIKAMHRLIMLSHTYQQSSANNPTYAQIDPFNKLLWRANIRRLDFEAVRDSVLAIGGSLDLTQYGRPVELTKEPFITRRTVYGYIDRSDLPEMFNHFDFANPDMTNGKRTETIVPQQALFMMNSPIVVEQARNLIELSEFEALKTDDDRINFLYDRILQRPPSSTELRLSQRFITSGPTVLDKPDAVAASAQPRQKKAKGKGKARVTAVQRNREPLTNWAEFAQALFMSNEATFVN